MARLEDLKEGSSITGVLPNQVVTVMVETREGRSLRDLLIDAIRYGNRPEVRSRLQEIVDSIPETVKALIEEKALAHDFLDASRVQKIREDMERAEVRRLQPFYIASFFKQAFEHLGGRMVREPLLFEKELQTVEGKPLAKFVCPGHPLLDATVDIIIERYRELLKQGAILVDENDPGDEPRALFYLEHSIEDARTDKTGQHRVVSKRLLFVEIDGHGNKKIAGYAPYLDYRPLTEEERALLPGSAGVSPAGGRGAAPTTHPAGETPALPGKHLGWHSRGYLPHLDHPGAIQSITFRLFDSVPAAVIQAWKTELRFERDTAEDDPRAIELRKRIDRYEDQGYGACFLRDPRIATLVENALLHFDGSRYRLIAWCIMPNHVHVLAEMFDGCPLHDVLHSWKSYTSKEANKILGRSGQFWLEEYHDRYIRDENHFHAQVNYIEQNPVKAGLCRAPEDWLYSSRRRSAGVPPASPIQEDATRPHPPAGGTPALPGTLVLPGGEKAALSFAIEQIVPAHFAEVKQRKERIVTKAMSEVKDRLTKEINYWDHRANELKNQELAGRINARLNSGKARQRAEDLEGRLQKRTAELEQERQLSPLPSVVVGGALIVPIGLIDRALTRTNSGPVLNDGHESESTNLGPNTVVQVVILQAHAILDQYPKIGSKPVANPEVKQC